MNCVAPGRIATAMAAAVPDAVNRDIAARIPLARLGTSAEVAEAVGFLVSEQAAYLTGVTLDVNGGYFMA
ncbi:3-oxoacyl-[acyl-carrier-protein] reductase FabG [compost metagenome]